MTKHPSKAYNPDIANALFRSGYIESWGRGTLKMMKECELAGLPLPTYFYDMLGFFVEFRKDIYNEKYLSDLGLNERQVKSIVFTNEKGTIDNKAYQEINLVSKRTATNELSELVEKFKLLNKIGFRGAGIYYELNRAIMRQMGQ